MAVICRLKVLTKQKNNVVDISIDQFIIKGIHDGGIIG